MIGYASESTRFRNFIRFKASRIRPTSVQPGPRPPSLRQKNRQKKENMRFSAVFLNLLTLLSLGVVVQTSSPYVLHESRSVTPSGWSLLRRYDASEVIPLRFGLKQSNMERLEELLNDVSHPDSPNYGNHWTPTQVVETFAPSNQSVATVRRWLEDNGFDPSRLRMSPTRSWLEVHATVEEAESLLQTKYNLYKHQNGKRHVGMCNHSDRSI